MNQVQSNIPNKKMKCFRYKSLVGRFLLQEKRMEKKNKQRIAIQQGSAGANGYAGMHTANGTKRRIANRNREKENIFNRHLK